MKETIIATYHQLNKENEGNFKEMNHQLQELNTKMERLEERFVLEEITQELFVKYKTKFKQEIADIQQRIEKSGIQVSNLQKSIDLSLDYAANLPEIWHSSGYQEKQKIQYMLFPEGIRYNKKIGECRTSKINSVFLWIAQSRENRDRI